MLLAVEELRIYSLAGEDISHIYPEYWVARYCGTDQDPWSVGRQQIDIIEPRLARALPPLQTSGDPRYFARYGTDLGT